MQNPAINFFSEGVRFNLKGKTKIREWLAELIENEQYRLLTLNYVFCNDEYLFTINQTYLNHITLTDVIAFDMSEQKEVIEGDIFISIERVKENSKAYGLSFYEELLRVMIHGLLHLTGYRDKTTSDRNKMKDKEDYYLSLLP